jgi:hypothetical protein
MWCLRPDLHLGRGVAEYKATFFWASVHTPHSTSIIPKTKVGSVDEKWFFVERRLHKSWMSATFVCTKHLHRKKHGFGCMASNLRLKISIPRMNVLSPQGNAPKCAPRETNYRFYDVWKISISQPYARWRRRGCAKYKNHHPSSLIRISSLLHPQSYYVLLKHATMLSMKRTVRFPKNYRLQEHVSVLRALQITTKSYASPSYMYRTLSYWDMGTSALSSSLPQRHTSLRKA